MSLIKYAKSGRFLAILGLTCTVFVISYFSFQGNSNFGSFYSTELNELPSQQSKKTDEIAYTPTESHPSHDVQNAFMSNESVEGVVWTSPNPNSSSVLISEIAEYGKNHIDVPREAMPKKDVLPEDLSNTEAIPDFDYPIIKPRKEQDNPRMSNPQTLGTQIDGPGSASNSWPPDTDGDVGPTEILMNTNQRFQINNKTSGAVILDVSHDTFWNAVLGSVPGFVLNSASGDPRVRYDRISQRWFLVAFTGGNPNRLLVAVSNGPSITSAASFTGNYFIQDVPGGCNTATPACIDVNDFADYPTLGVDQNALYIGCNMFNSGSGSFSGSTGFVINKANFMTGTLTVTAFRNIGITTPVGVHNHVPGYTEGYFIGSTNPIGVRRISTPGATPAISSPGNVAVPTVTAAIARLTQGATYPIDSVSPRYYTATLNRERTRTLSTSGGITMWTANAIRTGNTGASSGTGDRNSARWHEIGTMNAVPSLIQSGTLFDTAATNPLSYWMPTTASTGQGFMALGVTYGAASSFADGAFTVQGFPGIAVSGRLRENSPSSPTALNGTEPRTIAFQGQAAYTDQNSYNASTGTTTSRWGDYSYTSVDPNDDQTMWTIQEYSGTTPASGRFRLRAIELFAPPPCKPVACSTSLPLDFAGNYQGVLTINATSVSGSECYDGNVLDWANFRDYASYGDNVGTAIAGSNNGPGFHGPGGFDAAGNGHLVATSGTASTGTGTAAVQPFAPNAPGNSTVYLSPTSFKVKINITGATSGSKFPLTVRNPDGQVITTSDAICVAAPTAGDASVSGRLRTPAGRGLANAIVKLTNSSTGEIFQTRSTSLGYFSFRNLDVGDFYILSVLSKRYQFTDYTFTLNDDLDGIVLTAQ